MQVDLATPLAKLEMHLPFDPITPLLGMYSQRDARTMKHVLWQLFTVAVWSGDSPGTTQPLSRGPGLDEACSLTEHWAVAKRREKYFYTLSYGHLQDIFVNEKKHAYVHIDNLYVFRYSHQLVCFTNGNISHKICFKLNCYL